MPSQLPKLHPTRHGDTAWTDSGQHVGRIDFPLNAQIEHKCYKVG
jgi:broad specificity phosphatase PhoE